MVAAEEEEEAAAAVAVAVEEEEEEEGEGATEATETGAGEETAGATAGTIAGTTAGAGVMKTTGEEGRADTMRTVNLGTAAGRRTTSPIKVRATNGGARATPRAARNA